MRFRPSMRMSETTKGSNAKAPVDREASRIRAAIRFIVDSVVLFGRGDLATAPLHFFQSRHHPGPELFHLWHAALATRYDDKRPAFNRRLQAARIRLTRAG